MRAQAVRAIEVELERERATRQRYEAALRKIARGDVAPHCDSQILRRCYCWQCVAREALADDGR
jgi:predicted transcriptional regulator